VDLVKGTISESGIHRGRGTVVGCSLEFRKLESPCGQVARTRPISREKRMRQVACTRRFGRVHIASNYHVSGIHEERAWEIDTPTREVASCERCLC
jgi:hypothetical protein